MKGTLATMHHLRIGLLAAAAILALWPLPAAARQPPRLVLQITVDALRGDLPRRYAHVLGDGGFRYLMDQGVYYTDVVKMISGVKCDVEAGWSMTEPQMSRIDNDTYALSYVTTVEGRCTAEGKTDRLPSPVRASTVWARHGEQWQVVFHGENPIMDPAAAPATNESDEPTKDDTTAAGADEVAAPAASPATGPLTDALMAAESAVWEAWRAHDGGKIDALTSGDMSFVNIFGAHFPDKAAAIKDWTSTACNVTRVTLTHGAGTSISPTVGILTLTGTVEGTCGAQDISGQEIYATTVYVKDGDAWKWAFGFNSPS